MFLRWLPPAFGSSLRSVKVYFVATTKWSRSEAMNSPTSRSLVPFV
jgi:hypothetical protein